MSLTVQHAELVENEAIVPITKLPHASHDRGVRLLLALLVLCARHLAGQGHVVRSCSSQPQQRRRAQSTSKARTHPFRRRTVEHEAPDQAKPWEEHPNSYLIVNLNDNGVRMYFYLTSDDFHCY